MAADPAPLRHALRRSGAAAAIWLAGSGIAVAFPLIDPSNQGTVPTGTELAAPDLQDLRHQLQLANGMTPTEAGGWIILPSLNLQEMFTDNVLQVSSPRRWDFVTYASPGLAVVGDTARVQFRMDYAPTLSLYARTGSENTLSHQLNATGLFTIVPDLFYIDTRALAGVQAANGGIGGLGGLGVAGQGPASIGNLTGTGPSGLALTKQNQVQTSSFGISPYLLSRFGQYGSGKLGYSLNVSHYDTVSGFASSPFPTGGANGQTLISNEEVAHYVSDDFLGQFQNSFDIDLYQSNSTTNQGSGFQTFGNTQTTSNRNTVSDQLSYAVNHAITVFVSAGYEDITYTGGDFTDIHDATWSVGGTFAPDPDSAITLSYGHQQGETSFSADAHYAVTARTFISLNYTNTLGTQLENLQRQLNNAAVNGNGALVNAQTGGQLFSASNALSVQPGLFRFNTLNLGVTTTRERDQFSLGLVWSTQTSEGGGTLNTGSSSAKTASVQWVRQLRPDLSFSAVLSYSLLQPINGSAGGNDRSIAASTALQYIFSDTLSGTLRYSFYDRNSEQPGQSLYQNLLIIGVSKQF